MSRHHIARLGADVLIGDGVHLHPRVPADTGVAEGVRLLFQEPSQSENP